MQAGYAARAVHLDVCRLNEGMPPERRHTHMVAEQEPHLTTFGEMPGRTSRVVQALP